MSVIDAEQSSNVQIPEQEKPVLKDERWIGGPVFDGIFFLFPTVFAAGVVYLFFIFSQNIKLASFLNSVIFGLGLAHAAGTIFFFTDKGNFRRYMRQYFSYLLMPALLILFSIAMSFYDPWGVLTIIFYVWINQHLTKQNTGFCSFYRHKCGVFGDHEKKIDDSLIISSALFAYSFAWLFWPRDEFPMTGFLTDYRSILSWLLIPLGAWMLWSIFRAVPARVMELKRSKFKSWPHVAMLITSFAFPGALLVMMGAIYLHVAFVDHPETYARINSYTLGLANVWMTFFEKLGSQRPMLLFGSLTFGLFAHYLQYLALLVLIHKHKYPTQMPSAFSHEPGAASSKNELIFGRLKINGAWILLTFVTLFALTVILIIDSQKANTIYTQTTAGSVVSTVAKGVLIGFSLTHYWLDAKIWAFRHPENRQNILPYVKPWKK